MSYISFVNRKESPFIERIYSEDIDRCLEFANGVRLFVHLFSCLFIYDCLFVYFFQEAAAAVSRAVHGNSLCINPVTDFSNVPKDCTLLQVG